MVLNSIRSNEVCGPVQVRTAQAREDARAILGLVKLDQFQKGSRPTLHPPGRSEAEATVAIVDKDSVPRGRHRLRRAEVSAHSSELSCQIGVQICEGLGPRQGAASFNRRL